MTTPKKVDILGEVLTGADAESFPGLAELSSLLVRPEMPAMPQDAAGPGKTPQRKRKVTHYLSWDISETLDRILPRVRELVPEKARKRVSKSRLVDSSLRLLLREFEEKGKESLLVRQYLHNNRDTHEP
ncbi:MAG: hypothetical protein M0017_10225 [Desulfobacteraceae bacterium]|nr:hypothetical protein [Desulfobacteraceae bacterium]